MEFISIFFILMSIFVLIYIGYLTKTSKRLPIILELFYLGIYGFIFLILVFPKILDYIQNLLGIQSAINFIIYLSIFVAYFIIFLLYQEKEKQREEITKLTREIAYLKSGKK